MDGLMEGSFTHAASGVHYKIFERDGAGWLSYARPETAPAGYLNGEVKTRVLYRIEYARADVPV